jgi:non-ribosomal peptide synthetase component E (peptide arylation enzyme)
VHIADHAISAAQSPALIVADGGTMSYGELYASSQRVAAVLYEAGLRRGEPPRIPRNHLGLPAFRAVLQRDQHPLHAR